MYLFQAYACEIYLATQENNTSARTIVAKFKLKKQLETAGFDTNLIDWEN
jgi:hypothetical protein